MVLDQEARIEPERLGLDARVDVVAKASRRIAVPTSRLGAADRPNRMPPRLGELSRPTAIAVGSWIGSSGADELTVGGLLGKPRR